MILKKFFLLNFVLLQFASLLACDCKQQSPLTIVECIKFDAILQCKIDSVSSCNTRSIAYTQVIEVYKGVQHGAVQLSFDCSSSCQMSFAKGERWLVYGKLNALHQLEVNFCDRNRKYFAAAKDDYFAVNTGLSFEDEIAYLKKNIGFKVKNAQHPSGKSIDITQRENALGSGGNNLLLLLASLIFFLIIYVVVTKKIK
ncbi:MAG: hypothetical protein IPP32_10180 [Bacteroidetes bacterium]|nr:hypothetical protein [Bacteroidota bacterium]